MQLDELIDTAAAALRRNRIILADVTREAAANHVNLNWWEIQGSDQNVGDYLSTVVVDYMKTRHRIVEDACSGTSHLYAIGSIIDGAYQDATVWGSGLLRGKSKYWWRYFRKLDIRCVRGPETRRALIQNGYSCPEIYGDPAILMPLLYRPAPLEKVYDYRVIPNHAYRHDAEALLSPLTCDWKHFIDEIVKSKLVISSSLHGIVLAEAYGVPAILLNENQMNLFKYRDYYHSTGRYEFPVAASVEEALNLEPAQIPDLSQMRENIMNAFPADLWR